MAPVSEKISDILANIGLRRNDVALVHAGVGAVAELEAAPLGPGEATMALHTGLTSVLGRIGTIATPAYYYDYARFGRTFILEKSPPDKSLGRYPRFLFAQPAVRRSLNPITSIQALGAQQKRCAPIAPRLVMGLHHPGRDCSNSTHVAFFLEPLFRQ